MSKICDSLVGHAVGDAKGTSVEFYMGKREYNYSQKSIDLYSRLLKEDIRELKIDDVNSSDYIVDTIKALFWCLLTNNSNC